MYVLYIYILYYIILYYIILYYIIYSQSLNKKCEQIQTSESSAGHMVLAAFSPGGGAEQTATLLRTAHAQLHLIFLPS